MLLVISCLLCYMPLSWYHAYYVTCLYPGTFAPHMIPPWTKSRCVLGGGLFKLHMGQIWAFQIILRSCFLSRPSPILSPELSEPCFVICGPVGIVNFHRRVNQNEAFVFERMHEACPHVKIDFSPLWCRFGPLFSLQNHSKIAP